MLQLDASLVGLGTACGNMVYAPTFTVWVNNWANKRIEIKCGNLDVVEVTSVKIKDEFLAICAIMFDFLLLFLT